MCAGRASVSPRSSRPERDLKPHHCKRTRRLRSTGQDSCRQPVKIIVVGQARRYEPQLNPAYQDFAEHYGVAILPARVRRPRDKAKVESGVAAPGPDDTFGYQKYALPDPPADEALPVKGGVSFDTLPESYPAEETLREGRGLRVSHTMIGVMNPLADGGHPASARPVSTRPSAASEADTPRGGASPREERPKDSPSTAPRRGNWEEPVDLPTRGLPPPLLATLVVSGMVLAALLGYLALQ